MIKLEYEIANKYLKSKRKESFIAFISWFALIGITLGVAVLIIVMSVMNGFRKDIVNSIIGSNAHIYIYNDNISNDVVKHFPEYVAKLNKINGVRYASADIEEQALINTVRGSSGVVISGLFFEDLKQREMIFRNLKNIDLSAFKNGENVILLGRALARNLGVRVGDNITIISPKGYNTLVGSIPQFGTVKVIGIINTGMYQYDASVAVVPFFMAQKFFNYGNTTQQISIFVKDPQNVERVEANIYEKIPQISFMQNWKDSNHYFINALEVERNVMFLILSLVILIAAFNIVSGLIMLVRSKTKEIAILQAMGLSQNSILKIFLFIGIKIGFLGTILGTILGVVFSYNIDSVKNFLETITGTSLFAEEVYFLSNLPVDIESFQIILIVSLSMIFSTISAIYPALNAAKIKPSEGLKYD